MSNSTDCALDTHTLAEVVADKSDTLYECHLQRNNGLAREDRKFHQTKDGCTLAEFAESVKPHAHQLRLHWKDCFEFYYKGRAFTGEEMYILMKTFYL